MTRLAMNVGRDHTLRPGDVVGMILGTSGIPKPSVGAIHLLPKMTLVDIADEHVGVVVKKLSGIKFKGRRLEIHPAA